MKPEVETTTFISGSYRKNLPSIEMVADSFLSNGFNVIAPFCTDLHQNTNFAIPVFEDNHRFSERRLESEILKTITKVDFLYLADIEGKVGFGTAAEMAYAYLKGIPIIAAEEIKNFAPEVSEEARKLLAKSVIRILPPENIFTNELQAIRDILKDHTIKEITPAEQNILSELILAFLRTLKGNKEF